MESLSEIFKLHDKYQLEMKFTYPLGKDRELNAYHVDTYIFFPGSLGLTPSTYFKEDFYADMQEYIRLKTPAVLLRVMTDGAASPIRRLETAMRALAENPGEKTAAASYEERLKMFCSIMKSALRDEEAFLERSPSSLNFQMLIENYLSVTDDVLKQFRALRIIIEIPGISGVGHDLFRMADEFLSITANKYRYKLWIFLNTGATRSWTEKVKTEIVDALNYEISYRKECGFRSVPSVESENEELIYRESALKKIMASVLFLKTTTRRDGVLIENLVFGIAAGIAMAFATIVTMVTQRLFFSEISIMFVLIVVMSYIGKDRIKDFLKMYFQARIRRFIYDFKTDIRSGLGKKVGVCKEGFSFVNELSVDPRILKIRHREFITELANGGFGETVILGRKYVTLSTKNTQNLFSDFKVDGIVDIMRFNVHKFLSKMDNPIREVFLPDGKGGIQKIRGKRVYHINIIIRYGMDGREDSYARYRIILSRNGIKRIETFPIVVSVCGDI